MMTSVQTDLFNMSSNWVEEFFKRNRGRPKKIHLDEITFFYMIKPVETDLLVSTYFVTVLETFRRESGNETSFFNFAHGSEKFCLRLIYTTFNITLY